MMGTASWIWRANDSESCRRRKSELAGAWSPVNHTGLSQGREKREPLEVLHLTLLLERLTLRYCTWPCCWKGLPWGTAPEPAVGKAYLEVLHWNLLLALPWGTAPEPAVGKAYLEALHHDLLLALPWGTAPEPAVVKPYLEVLHQNLLLESLILRYCTRTCCWKGSHWGTAPKSTVSFTLRYCTRTCC